MFFFIGLKHTSPIANNDCKHYGPLCHFEVVLTEGQITLACLAPQQISDSWGFLTRLHKGCWSKTMPGHGSAARLIETCCAYVRSYCMHACNIFALKVTVRYKLFFFLLGICEKWNPWNIQNPLLRKKKPINVQNMVFSRVPPLILTWKGCSTAHVFNLWWTS